MDAPIKIRKKKVAVSSSGPSSKPYKEMIIEALSSLDKNKRTGVSVISIMKFIEASIGSKTLMKFHCKKAIEKGIEDGTFVNTTGRSAMSGSIAFGKEYKKQLKGAKKNMPPVKEPTKSKPASKTAPMKSAKTKSGNNSKKNKDQPKKSKADLDNKHIKQLPTKNKKPAVKASVTKATGKVRLSIPMPAPTVKPGKKRKLAEIRK